MQAGFELALHGSIMAVLYAVFPETLSLAGLAVAIAAYISIGYLVLSGLSYHQPHRNFGIANSITLGRAAFGAIVFALAIDIFGGHRLLSDPVICWVVTGAAALSLVLDGIDGWMARRTGLASAFGANFDMHTDAFFVLALSLLIAAKGTTGPWIIVSGLVFYAFLLAGAIWPVLMNPLPPRWRRKAVCVMQTALLIVVLAPATPFWAAQLAGLTGLALLLWSFGIDLVWLIANRPSPDQGANKPYRHQE